jgi:hypothetical protein
MARDINLNRPSRQEELDRRPRWERWAEQQFETGWTLVIDAARERALWTRDGTSLDVTLARAWAIVDTMRSRFGKHMRVPKHRPRVMPAPVAKPPVTPVQAPPARPAKPAPGEKVQNVQIVQKAPARPAKPVPAKPRGQIYTSPKTGRQIRVFKSSPDTVAQVERLYGEDVEWAEIERRTGVPRWTGCMWVGLLGLRRSHKEASRRRVQRDAPFPPGVQEEAVRLYTDPENPLSTTAVAKRLGVSTSRIHRLLSQHGVLRTPAKGVRLSKRSGYARRAASALDALAAHLSNQDPLVARLGALAGELRSRFQ